MRYEFKRVLKYKCELHSIDFKTVDKYYASSKTCSCCGNRKPILSLSERMYKCDVCGLKINRDLNASINLKNYKFIQLTKTNYIKMYHSLYGNLSSWSIDKTKQYSNI